MTKPKVATFKTGGGRYYTHPTTGDKVPGVTSVLNMLPKPFLKPWGEKMVATAAVDALADSDTASWLPSMAKSDPEGAIDWLKAAPRRNTRDAANIGTAAHGIFEALLLGRPVDISDENLLVFARHYENLLETVNVKPIHTEETVWNMTHSYAGSFDLFGEVSGEKCWVDNKTTRSGVYPEVALQLSAYANGEVLVDAHTGEDKPIPKGARGLVFHVRPEGWKIFEVPIGPEVFEHFLHLRQTFVWEAGSRSIVGKPLVAGAAPSKKVIL